LTYISLRDPVAPSYRRRDAICAVLCALVSLASAQTNPSATKNKLAVELSPRKINFGKVAAGIQSTAQNVTLSNKGSVELSTPLVTVTGTGFSLESNGCISAIPPAGSCPVSVRFTPPAKGNFKNGLLKFTDAAAGSPQKVKLIGVGLTHFYCFDVSHITTLTVTPASGRIAFVSRESFATMLGLSSADTLCHSEATAGGLSNPTQFLAMLSTSTASAASRFDLSAMSPSYVRPDGIEIADAPTIAAGSTLDSGIWQHADGSYVTEFGLQCGPVPLRPTSPERSLLPARIGLRPVERTPDRRR
jgi:centrosomal CEP192-like protein